MNAWASSSNIGFVCLISYTTPFSKVKKKKSRCTKLILQFHSLLRRVHLNTVSLTVDCATCNRVSKECDRLIGIIKPYPRTIAERERVEQPNESSGRLSENILFARRAQQCHSANCYRNHWTTFPNELCQDI